MSQTSQSDISLEGSSLPGVDVVARIRRLFVVGLVAAVGYSLLMSASKGYCPGGVNAEGGFADAAGNATDTAPVCINLTLQPSWLVFFAIAAVGFGTLTMVLRRAADVPTAIRYLDRASAAIAVVAVASVAISQIWFATIPVTEWDGTGTFFFPFPFGSVGVEIEPMPIGQAVRA